MEEDKKHPTEESDYSYIQEKIKDRPINKRKLLKKMLVTVGGAVLFGLVACFTFIFLGPVINNLLSSGEEVVVQQINIPEIPYDDELGDIAVSDVLYDDTTTFEETPIQDMSFDDEEMAMYADDVQSASVNESYELAAASVIVENEYEIKLEDYQTIHRMMYQMSQTVGKSIATITSVTDVNELYEGSYNVEGKTSGIIVGNNGYEILIFADSRNIADDGAIWITFCDNNIYEGSLKKKDEQTGFAIYAVPINIMDETTLNSYTICTIGTSSSLIFMGSSVMAVGDPLNNGKSICYGMVTSMDSRVYMEDEAYQLVTTDMFGSTEGYGFLFNTRGQAVGIITHDNHEESMENLIYAYGISSLRPLMESMANGVKRAGLGIVVTDVTPEAQKGMGIPAGAYISKVSKDSPAMNVGLQPGDIIVSMDDTAIQNVTEYGNYLKTKEPDDSIMLSIMRFVADEYIETEIQITTKER